LFDWLQWALFSRLQLNAEQRLSRLQSFTNLRQLSLNGRISVIHLRSIWKTE
jgi:hypothetical protein